MSVRFSRVRCRNMYVHSVHIYDRLESTQVDVFLEEVELRGAVFHGFLDSQLTGQGGRRER